MFQVHMCNVPMLSSTYQPNTEVIFGSTSSYSLDRTNKGEINILRKNNDKKIYLEIKIGRI